MHNLNDVKSNKFLLILFFNRIFFDGRKRLIKIRTCLGFSSFINIFPRYSLQTDRTDRKGPGTSFAPRSSVT